MRNSSYLGGNHFSTGDFIVRCDDFFFYLNDFSQAFPPRQDCIYFSIRVSYHHSVEKRIILKNLSSVDVFSNSKSK